MENLTKILIKYKIFACIHHVVAVIHQMMEKGWFLLPHTSFTSYYFSSFMRTVHQNSNPAFLTSSNLYFSLEKCLCLVSLVKCCQPFVSRLTAGRTLNKRLAPQVVLLVSMATNCCCFLCIPVLKCLHHLTINNICSTTQMQSLSNVLPLHLKTP